MHKESVLLLIGRSSQMGWPFFFSEYVLYKPWLVALKPSGLVGGLPAVISMRQY